GETQTAGEDLAPTAAPSTTTPSGPSRRDRLPQAEPDSGPCRPDRRDRHNGGGTRLEGSGTDRTGWEDPGPKGPHHQDQRASERCVQGAEVRELTLPIASHRLQRWRHRGSKTRKVASSPSCHEGMVNGWAATSGEE